MIPFAKMHGCGNDFVILRHGDLESLALDATGLAAFVRHVCARHEGVGADGILSYAPVEAGLRMRYWNRDGSRAEMCGNGARCIVRLACERGEAEAPLRLVTDAGTHQARLRTRPQEPPWVEIQMGMPTWEGAALGLAAGETLVDASLRVGSGDLRVTALALGNPHAVVFLPDRTTLEALPLATAGRNLAEHARFARGANASFVALAGDELHLRVWERGVGPTLACGSAACAALAAAHRLGKVGTPGATVHMPGGSVEVRLDAAGQLWLAGPATHVAEGMLHPEALGLA